MTNFMLKPIEHSGQRVVTTAQLADAYETTQKTINDNFQNNKSHFIEGKHYYRLTGEDLKKFKNCPENFGVVNKRTPCIYLWTERGALLHAKSLNTDKAWEVYDYLIDHYFRAREQSSIVPYADTLLLLHQKQNELERSIMSLENDIKFIECTLERRIEKLEDRGATIGDISELLKLIKKCPEMLKRDPKEIKYVPKEARKKR